MKCRTCLKVLDVKSSQPLTKKLHLGLTYQEMIVPFVPEMVNSRLIGNLVCDDCANTVKIFAKFIEMVVEVDKYLITKDMKRHKQVQPSVSTVGDLEVVNNETLITHLDEYFTEQVEMPINNKDLNVESSDGGKQLLKIEIADVVESPAETQTVIIPLKTYSRKRKFPLPIPIKVEVDDTVATSRTEKSIENQTCISNNKDVIGNGSDGNWLYLNLQDKEEQSNLLKMNETSVPVSVNNITQSKGISKEFIENFVTDIINRQDSVPNKNSLNMPIENSIVDIEKNYTNILKIINKQSEPEHESLMNILEDARQSLSNNDLTYEDHNRVISIAKTNNDIVEFLNKFPSNEVTVSKLGTLNETSNKRILLVGTAFIRCPECNAQFASRSSIRFHFNRAHPHCVLPVEENKFDLIISSSRFSSKPLKPCMVCTETFTTTRMLNKHLSQNHKDYYHFKCEHCGKGFKKKCRYADHTKNYENYGTCRIRQCSICKEVVAMNQFRNHITTHRNFQCNICQKNFCFAAMLKKHHLTHQKVTIRKKKLLRKELCYICGKFTFAGSAMTQHLITHSSDRSYLCHICSKSFKLISALRKHIRQVHDNTEYYECTQCKKRAKTKEAMRYHIRLKHSNTYSFRCNVCDKGFTRGDYYRRHMNHQHFLCGQKSKKVGDRPVYRVAANRRYVKRNENDPLFTCKFCSRQYRTVHQLRLHLLASHLKDAIRYKCRYCSMTFKSMGNRLRHEKRHRNPEDFELTCQVCWNRFSSKEELQVHVLNHKGSEKHTCDVCGEMFARKYLLQHHKNEVHFDQEQHIIQKRELLEEGLSEFLTNI